MSPLRCMVLLSTFLALAGCQSARSTDPNGITALPPGRVESGRALRTDFAVQYRLTVDAESLACSLVPLEPERHAGAQATRFDLDIRRFMRGDTLQFTRIRRTPAGDLEIRWKHQHPFAAPDLSQPPSGRNRADLGYTGRLLILADGVQRSFFGGEVRLDPTLVFDADGYVKTGDLLLEGTFNNNAFPYQLLADSAKFSETGPSFSDPRGSYGFFGNWTRSSLGADGLGWTGMDYIHAGQQSSGTMTLRREALEAGTLTIGLALLIQWTDPKGVAGAEGFFPPESNDPAAFAYRLPFGAIDCSQIVVPNPLEIPQTAGSTVGLSVGVRDWDAQATEAADPNLSDEFDVTLIQPGGRGEPTVEFVAPALFSGTVNLSYRNLGNGEGGGPLYYSGNVTNNTGATTPAFGCLRVTDPEAADAARTSYHFGVDPSTLIPEASRALLPVTYQVVRIRPVEPPSASTRLYSTVLRPGSTPFNGESWLMCWRPAPIEVPGTRGTSRGCLMVDIPVGSTRGLMVEKGAMLPTGPGDFVMLDLPGGGNRVNLTLPGNYLRGLSPGLTVEEPLSVPGTRPFIYLDTALGSPRFMIADSVTGGPLHEPLNIGLPPPVWFLGGQMVLQDLGAPAWNPVNDEEYCFSIGGGVYEFEGNVLVDGRIYRQNFFRPSPPAQAVVIPRIDGTEAAFWPAYDQVGGMIFYTHIDLTTDPADPFHIAFVNAGGGTPADLPIPIPVPPTPNRRLLPMHVAVSSNGEAIAFATVEVDITTFEVFGASDLWEYQLAAANLVRVTNTPTEWELWPTYQ